MSIPAGFLDELRNRLTLSELIGRKVKLVRAGREFKGCCPFHREKTPSFTVNDEKHFYHCFGCGAHGDAVGFLMQHDNLAFPEAVEILAAQAGMQVPRDTPRDAEQEKGRRDLLALMDESARFFQDSLYDQRNRQALDYIHGRGLAEEIIGAYRIGFSPEDPQALIKHLKSKGFSPQDLLTAGVAKTSERSREPYAFFRGRIMFPVTDRRGRCVAFGGRILPEHLRPPDRGNFTPPKYINSPDSPLFHKSRVLYGEAHARMEAGKGGILLVVEGYMDVIACAAAGFRGAVAPMGTALTEEQIASLWKMAAGPVKEPVLCFDGDTAGRRAAERARDRILPLLQPGQSARFAFLPEGEDPDTMIRSRGADSFRSVLERSLPLSEFLWFSLTSGRLFSTPESQAGLKKELLDQVARIADRDVQQLYRQQLLQRFSQEFFSSGRFGGNQGSGRRARPSGAPLTGGQRLTPRRPGRPVDHRKTLSVRILLAAAINHPHIYDEIEEALGCLPTDDPGLDRLRQYLVGYLSDNPLTERDKLQEALVQSGFQEEINDILSESVYVHASFCGPRALPETVASCWLAFWRDLEGREQRTPVGQA